MKKIRIPKWLTVSVCVALALCAALLFEYQRHLVKPFYSVAPFARHEITSVVVDLKGYERLELDEGEAAELLAAFSDCRVKLKSSDGWFTNCYGRVFVTTARDHFRKEIMLSEGCVGFPDGNDRIAIYYIVEGEETLRREVETAGQ